MEYGKKVNHELPSLSPVSIFSKDITYDECSKMKRDAGLKAVFLEKDCFRRSEFPYHWLSAVQKR